MAKIFSARFLLAGFILLLVLMLVLVVAGNLRKRELAVIKEIVQSEDDLAMQSLNYTETRDGVRKWTLQADSASHSLKQKTAQLKQLRLTVFNPSAGDLVVTSQTGRLDLQRREVLLQGGVLLRAASGETIRTEELLFVDRDKVVRTDSMVHLLADGYRVSGEGMRYEVDNRRLVLNSAVDAVYSKGLNVK